MLKMKLKNELMDENENRQEDISAQMIKKDKKNIAKKSANK